MAPEPEWIGRLERRFGEWTVPDLALFIVGMNGLAYLLTLLKPAFPAMLALDPEQVWAGQAWRLVTYVIVPPGLAPLWMLLWLYFLWVISSALEVEWGEFRFNLYYWAGTAALAAAAMATGLPVSNAILNLSLLFAFAGLFPEHEVLLFFILPVKTKWLAWVGWAGIALELVMSGWPARACVTAGLANYALFFGPGHWREAYAYWRRRRGGWGA